MTPCADYAVRELVIVVPVTTRMRGIPVEVPLGRDEALPRRCDGPQANAEGVRGRPGSRQGDRARRAALRAASHLER